MLVAFFGYVIHVRLKYLRDQEKAHKKKPASRKTPAYKETPAYKRILAYREKPADEERPADEEGPVDEERPSRPSSGFLVHGRLSEVPGIDGHLEGYLEASNSDKQIAVASNFGN